VQRLQQVGRLSQELLLRAGACRRRETSGCGARSAAPAPPSIPPAPHAPSRALSTAAPSSRCSRAPRIASSAASRAHSALKSGHQGPRDAASAKAPYLRRDVGQCEYLSVRVLGRARPSCAPGHAAQPLTLELAGPGTRWPPLAPPLLPSPWKCCLGADARPL
jgi:hypothetical protein